MVNLIPKSLIKLKNSKTLGKFAFSQIDIDILKLSQASICNYAMTPLIGTIDTYWISRLKDPSILAGQGSADRLFNSIYSILSIAPSIITPLISKYHSVNNKEKMASVFSNTFFIVSSYSVVLTFFIFFKTNFLISTIIPNSSKSYLYACQYFQLRSIGLIFSLLNSLAFSTMSGQKDLNTPIKINLISQLSNAILDPILMIFMGVRGVALGTILSEFLGFILFYSQIIKNNLINFKNKIRGVKKFFIEGINIQIRSVSLSLIYLLASRKIQYIDKTDILSTTHIINSQLFEFGFIISYSYGKIPSILIPRYKNTRHIQNKIYKWGIVFSIFVSIIHIILGNYLSVLTTNQMVLHKSKNIIYIGSILQAISTFTCINEGISQSYEMFKILSFGSVISLTIFSISIINAKDLINIWIGFCIASLSRTLVNYICIKKFILKYKK